MGGVGVLLMCILGEQTESVERDLAANSCSASSLFLMPSMTADLNAAVLEVFDEKFIHASIWSRRGGVGVQSLVLTMN